MTETLRLTDWRKHPWKDEIIIRRVGDAVNVQCKAGTSGGMADPWFYEIAEFDFHNRWTIVQYSWIDVGHWYMVFAPVKENTSEFKPFQPKPLEEVAPLGRITRERYRQMKLLNRRRWQQIQKLELLLAQTEGGSVDDKGNIGTLASFEKDYTDQLAKKGVAPSKREAIISEKLAKLLEVKEGQLNELLNMSRNERRLWFKEQKKKG